MKKYVLSFRSFIQYFFQILLVGIISCSEPYSFGVNDSVIDVIDAKISTLEGESYVKAYSILNGQNEASKKNLDVTIISANGDTYSFVYNGRFQRYSPSNSNFIGQAGLKYRMEAIDENGVIYRSRYDSIPRLPGFDIDFKETTITEVTDSKVIVTKRAIKTTANVNTFSEYFFRLDFRYSFNIEGTNVLSYEPDEFILKSHNDNLNNAGEVQIPVGYIIPCCFSQADVQVSLESMTRTSYEFWKSSQELINNDGLIFNSFPFPLKGNIDCENCDNDVVGIFRAVSENQNKRIWRQ